MSRHCLMGINRGTKCGQFGTGEAGTDLQPAENKGNGGTGRDSLNATSRNC